MKQPKSQTSFFSNSGELNIPMDLGMLLIGPGVSISSNSIMFAIKNWLHLAFSSETNVPTGIIPTTGKLGSREFAKNQALFYSDDKKSLDYALVLLKKRFDDIDITPSASIEQIRGIEGIKVKNLYKQIRFYLRDTYFKENSFQELLTQHQKVSGLIKAMGVLNSFTKIKKVLIEDITEQMEKE